MSNQPEEHERLLGENRSPQRIDNQQRRNNISSSTQNDIDDTFSSIITGILTFTLFVTLIGFLTGAWFVQQQSHRPYIVTLLLLSIVPSIFILYFAYYWRNKASAPVPLIIGCYLIGIFMALPVALVESIVTESLFPERPKGSVAPALTTRETSKIVFSVFCTAFFCVALIEEGAKFLYTWYRKTTSDEFLTSYGIVIVALTCSLGFASLENAAYIFHPSSRLSDAFETALARAIMSVPLHACCGALIGIGFARRRLNERNPNKKVGFVGFILFWPVVIHGLYDVVLMIPDALKHIPAHDHNVLERVGMFVSSVCVVLGCYLAMTFGRNLVKETEGEVARQVKWPSGEALEQASGCA